MLDNLTIYNLHIYYFDNVSLLTARVAASICMYIYIYAKHSLPAGAVALLRS